MPGISFFSPTVLASFVTAFGAFGMIFSKIPGTSSMWISAPMAAVSGGIIAALVFWFFNTMFEKTQSSSESRVATLVGMTGLHYHPDPGQRRRRNRLCPIRQRYTAPRAAKMASPLPRGQPVRITRIIGSQFYVETAAPAESTNKNQHAST